MLNPNTEVSKPLYRIPLLFTESHTEENPISSAELFLSQCLRAGHGRTKFINIMTLIKIAQTKRMIVENSSERSCK
jgi:hypothetical protein